MGICYETLMEDEETQVRGLVHFADGGGVSFPHLTLFTPKEAVRIVKNGEVGCNIVSSCNCLVARHVQLYLIDKNSNISLNNPQI